MTPVDDRIERLRDDLHGVDTRLVRVETELRLHREQSAQQHDDIMAAIADLRRDVTPRPPPSLPPGPALSTMPADHDPSSDPGAVTISPKRVGPWLDLLVRWVRRLLLIGATAGGVHACERWSGQAEPTETAP